MARLVGTAGNVLIGTATATGIKGWNLDYTFKVEETTGFDSGGHRAFTPVIDEWSGNFEGFKDGAPLTPGTLVALSLKESATTGQIYTGSAIVMGLHGTVVVDSVVTYKYDFQGSGALTLATA